MFRHEEEDDEIAESPFGILQTRTDGESRGGDLMIEAVEETIQNVDGQTLFFRSWRPPQIA